MATLLNSIAIIILSFLSGYIYAQIRIMDCYQSGFDMRLNMATVDNLQSAAEFLAGKLMEWRDHKLLDVIWTDGKGFSIRKDRWQPYADTPEGLFQCLGKGGVVEEMRKRGWLLRLIGGYAGDYIARFSKNIITDVDACHRKAGAAITLAAASVLGWKEEG